MPIVNIGTGSEKYALDPSMYRQDANGLGVQRAENWALARMMGEDLFKFSDGDIAPEQAASLISGLLGPAQTTQLMPESDQEGNPHAYITDGVSRFEVSPQTYGLVSDYIGQRTAEFDRRMGRPVRPDETSMPGSPTSSPDYPQGWTADADTTQGASPAIPEALPQTAPTSMSPNPPAAPITGQGVPTDDTAVGSGVVNDPTQQQPVVDIIPELAEAVAAWNSTNRSPGREQQQLEQIINSLPKELRGRAIQEILNTGQ
jgi:hypothetical protein